LLVVADEARDWRPTSIEALALEDLEPVFSAAAGTVEFVLLGTGPRQALPPAAVRQALRQAGLGLEFLATDGAARLHNVLASEGRLFATALIAI
jgi:uncharacterized protein